MNTVGRKGEDAWYVPQNNMIEGGEDYAGYRSKLWNHVCRR